MNCFPCPRPATPDLSGRTERSRKLLTKIRRKVEHATQRAEEVGLQVRSRIHRLGDLKREALVIYDGDVILPRDFSRCYPSSVGPTTAQLEVPAGRVLDVEQARALAAGATVHKVLGMEPQKRRIIDRTAAVRRLAALHEVSA